LLATIAESIRLAPRDVDRRYGAALVAIVPVVLLVRDRPEASV
jgi:hypothetical protein